MSRTASSPILVQIARLVEDQRMKDFDEPSLVGMLGGPKNQVAFQALVQRHGPMVLDVCRCVLVNEADVEDAFQSTFLILARKARSIRKAASLASWLHGVAYRTALKAKADFVRREKHEARAASPRTETTDDPSWSEVRRIVHEEMVRIPERDRAPLVLCYLQGKTHDEAAALLKLAKGTFKGRLERGRALLRQRLVKRGLGPAALAILAAWPAPAALAAGTANCVDAMVTAAKQWSLGKVAAGAVSARVFFLTEGVMKQMAVRKGAGLAYALGIALSVGIAGAVLVPGSGHAPLASGAVLSEATSITSDQGKPDLQVEKLIGQLGSSEFGVRQAAAKELRKLGARALPQLKNAMRTADAEIAQQARKLETTIRADEIERLATALKPHREIADDIDHPLWLRFKKLVGDDRDSRKLFAELIASPQRAKLLDEVEAHPETAGAVYARLVNGYAKALQEGALKSTIPFDRLPTAYDIVAVMFLGTYSGASQSVWETGKPEITVVSVIEVAHKDPGFAVKARLLGAWLGTRTDPELIQDALNFAWKLKLKELRPLLRKWIADPTIAPESRAFSALYLGDIGAREDLPGLLLLAESKASAELFQEFNVILKGQEKLDALWGRQRLGGEKVSPEEWKEAYAAADIRKGKRCIADYAWTAAVHLAGGNPFGMGFFWPQTVKGKPATYPSSYHYLFIGFPDDKARSDAHAKAKELLDKLQHPQKVASNMAPEADQLVQQLGSPNFAERDAAEKALQKQGARAAAAIQAGMADVDAEIARRCESLWPKLWATEIARPDAERLAGYDHPLWKRFRKTVDDDPGSRTLFAEMAGDLRRWKLLVAVEAAPEKAKEAYAEELKLRVERMKRAYKEAEAEAKGNLGMLWPKGGIPNRGEFVTLLFLGTYPASATVAFQETNDNDRVSHHNVFGLGLQPSHRDKAEPISPALRRLYAAWLSLRTDANTIQFGMNLALYHAIKEALPKARTSAADAQLDPKARGFSLLAVGQFGSTVDLPILEKAFSDNRVFHATRYTNEAGQQRPVEALVGDAAIGSALKLSGQYPADFGYPLLEMYKERGPETLVKYHLLGFFDNETRQAAHKKAKEWLDTHKNEKPLPKPASEPSPTLRSALDELEGYRHSSNEKFAEMENRGRELVATFTERDDRARIYFQLAHVYAQSDISRHSDKVTKYGKQSLELSRDPVQRGTLFSYLASAAEVKTTGTFAERREKAAELLLQGYEELSRLKIPRIPPELPAVVKFNPDETDFRESERLQKQHDDEMQARKQAELIRELVQLRAMLVEQLRYLFAREPLDLARLRQLIEKNISDPEAAQELLRRVAPKEQVKPVPFEEQLKSARARIAELKLVEVHTIKDSIDKRNPIRFTGKNGPVEVKPGSAVLVELSSSSGILKWRWGDVEDSISAQNSEPFTHVFCQWADDGTITWVLYRSDP